MKKYSKIIKILVSFLLLFFIFKFFPVGDIFKSLKTANLWWFLVAVIFSEIMLLSQAFRWHYMILVQKEQKPKFRNFLYYTTVGYFFNAIAPGGLGGDAYRSIALGKEKQMLAQSVASVFLARLFGLAALCILFWFGFVMFSQNYSLNNLKIATPFMSIVSVALFILCALLVFNPVSKDRFKNTYLKKIYSVAEQIKEYKNHKTLIFIALLDSVFIQFLCIVMQFACFLSVGIDVPFAILFAIMPIAIIAVSIPLSLGGIGVREWSFLALSQGFIEPDKLLASMLLGYGIAFLLALQGGIFFIFNKGKK